MALIFLSYRRTDSPQACRVYDWLAQRLGHDAVFMDVAAIPFAVSFPDHLQQAIRSSKVMIALIGERWLAKIHQPEDPVRMEIEVALAHRIPLLPVLIGNTPMPTTEELPSSISSLAVQNAMIVGVLHDFHTHMQQLLPKIEAILGALAPQSLVTEDPEVIRSTCEAIIRYLLEQWNCYGQGSAVAFPVDWKIVAAGDVLPGGAHSSGVLLLHRVTRLAELLQLHFLLSFSSPHPSLQHLMAGWVNHQLERTPLIPAQAIPSGALASTCELKVRRSDEDPRQIWKMLTDQPLQLSLAYVATVSPKQRESAL